MATGTINGVSYASMEVHGDNAIFLGTDGNVVYKSKVVNGYDNTGYTERFRLFATINKDSILPVTYPSFESLHNDPITAPISITGLTGTTGLGWPYDVSKKLGGRVIHTVIGPSGTTGVLASTTYTYQPYVIPSAPTGSPTFQPPVDWVQEKVQPYIEGL